MVNIFDFEHQLHKSRDYIHVTIVKCCPYSRNLKSNLYRLRLY